MPNLPANYSFLIPSRSGQPAEKLLESIREMGILIPVVYCSDLLIDGHQRLAAANLLQINNIPTIEISGIPEILYLELNRHRSIAMSELVSLLSRSNDKGLFAKLVEKAGYSSTPQFLAILNCLIDGLRLTPEQLDSLPTNVWRELGHLDDKMEKAAAWLVNLSGTAAEKRLVAGLMRQAARKKTWPEKLPEGNAALAIAFFNRLVQPRRHKALDRIEPLLSSENLPAGVKVKFDVTFEHPGLDFEIHVGRNSLARFKLAQEVAEKIFSEVEEL
ncbi:MAG: ParB N-terminal domain-containing protein [Candidatus Rifleibacteriota bacterium]